MRAAFEQWAPTVGLSIEDENPIATGGRFLSPETNAAWEAWQAISVRTAVELEQLADDADPDDFASIALREAAKQLRGDE